jgi:hypothetical protein
MSEVSAAPVPRWRRILFWISMVALLFLQVGESPESLGWPIGAFGGFPVGEGATHEIHWFTIGTFTWVIVLAILVQLRRAGTQIGAAWAYGLGSVLVFGLILALADLPPEIAPILMGALVVGAAAFLLHPSSWRARFAAVEPRSPLLFGLVVLAAIPLIIYAAGQLEIHHGSGPADEHFEFGHWVVMGCSASTRRCSPPWQPPRFPAGASRCGRPGCWWRRSASRRSASTRCRSCRPSGRCSPSPGARPSSRLGSASIAATGRPPCPARFGRKRSRQRRPSRRHRNRSPHRADPSPLGSPSGSREGQSVVPAVVGELFSRTKFVPPAPDERVVGRPALQADLAATIERHPLTVVAAPAGSGKTTALAQWATDPGPWRPAWVRLDAGDDDATMLAWTLLGGLRSLHAHAGHRLEQALTQPGDTSPQRLAHIVANDLGDEPGAVLVLDDAHVLCDPGALSLLDLLLDVLHRDNRMVVAARGEPALSLPRRRARGQLGELGFQDLQLDETTIEQVLARAGDEDAAGHARRMAEATGGWAAAVRLLAPRIGTATGPPAMPTVDADAWSQLQRFMLTELLDSQPEEVRRFLVDTAVLDELTPAACTAVTGRADIAPLFDHLPEMTQLASRIATPDGQVALRCHDLFAAFLRERLAVERTKEEVRELHRRAATATPAPEAVQHLLDAGELDEAARKVCGIGRAQLAVGTPHLPAAWLHRFDDELRTAHPWLDLLDGRMQITLGRSPQARMLLERALPGMRAAGDEAGATRTALALAEAAIGTGDLATAAAVLADTPTAGLPTALHANVLLARVWHAFFALAWQPISAHLEEACDLVLPAADPAADEVLAFGFGSHLLFADHGPAWLEQRAATLVGRLRPDGPAAASVHATLAGAALLRADLAAAARRSTGRGHLRRVRRAGLDRPRHPPDALGHLAGPGTTTRSTPSSRKPRRAWPSSGTSASSGRSTRTRGRAPCGCGDAGTRSARPARR